MAKIKITAQKSDSNNWFFMHEPYAETFCTLEEMNNIIFPARNYISSMPGFQKIESTELNPQTLQIEIFYTTKEAADNANALIYESENKDEILVKAQTLVSSYRNTAQVNYTINRVVE